MSVYLEPVADSPIPFSRLPGQILGSAGPAAVERFCDRDGEYKRKYHVYRLTAGGQSYVLKRSGRAEAGLYERDLSGKGFRVPAYYGRASHEGHEWLLMEYIAGPDLRHFTAGMAQACAETLAMIQNACWGGREDGRFERYWQRVNRRARCLEGEPELSRAYDLFLKRQRTCPRTLSSGDFLQCNGIVREGRVYIIDWGFGGTMPYALDIARLVAHGTERPQPGAFPFYMDGELRRQFVEAMYDRLENKPDWEQYIMDIKLAVLNEYVEFLEEPLLDRTVGREEIEGDFYYQRARAAAREILS